MKKRSENQWFWWCKTIEKYWKTNTFLDFRSFKKTMKNRCQHGSQKSWKMIQNGARGRQGSIYSEFLLIFGEGEKAWFFDEVPGRPKNKENRPVERQRLEKSSPSNNKWTDRSPGGSRHSRLGIKRPTTRAWSHTPKGQRPGEFSIIQIIRLILIETLKIRIYSLRRNQHTKSHLHL
jgi:hypothetical protein